MFIFLLGIKEYWNDLNNSNRQATQWRSRIDTNTPHSFQKNPIFEEEGDQIEEVGPLPQTAAV